MWDDQIRFNLKISSEKAVFASNETKFESWLNLLLTFIFLRKNLVLLVFLFFFFP